MGEVGGFLGSLQLPLAATPPSWAVGWQFKSQWPGTGLWESLPWEPSFCWPCLAVWQSHVLEVGRPEGLRARHEETFLSLAQLPTSGPSNFCLASHNAQLTWSSAGKASHYSQMPPTMPCIALGQLWNRGWVHSPSLPALLQVSYCFSADANCYLAACLLFQMG